MKLEHLVGGLCAMLQDVTTPAALAILTVPPQFDAPLPTWASYGILGWLSWNGVLYVQDHEDIAARVERGEWDPRWARHGINRLNLYAFIRRHPEHREAYERFRRSVSGE